MATVVRVKRTCDDEPIEAFILNCKRRKISEDENTAPVSTTVFKFAGTIEKDADIVSHFDAKPPEVTQKIKSGVKKHVVSIEDKLRAEHKEASKRNRFKIVNRFRSQTENSTSKAGLDKSLTVLDLEKDLEEGIDDKPKSEDEKLQKYVYDLYYNHSDECKVSEMEDYISVHPVYDYNSIDSIADNDDIDDGSGSEDSNAESNWKNDYPDEEDVESDESVNEKDMVQAMKNFDLDDDLLSSDDENDFIYSIDDDGDTAYKSDLMRHGKSYAMFKAKYNKVVDSDPDSDDD